MASVDTETRTARTSTSPTRRRPALSRLDVRQGATAVGFVLLAVLLLPPLLSDYWISVATATAYMSVVALGLGLLMGRVGMVSLGQMAVLAMGAWVGAKLAFSTDLPYPLLLLAGGLVTMVLGTLVGLPALRMSGLYLALITLMLAGAITIAVRVTNFPNGGPGFLGHTDDAGEAVRRPSIAITDPAFFRYTVIVCALLFALVLWQLRGKSGRAWAAIRQSEAAAIAAGVNITRYKLLAFALASFITGVAGVLFASAVGRPFADAFPTQVSINLLAVVLMGGIFSLWGAVVAGVLFQLLPALLNDWGLPADLLVVIFGLGILQVLLTAPGGLAQQVPRDLAKLGRLLRRVGGRS